MLDRNNGGQSHHPSEAGFDPSHTVFFEGRRGIEFLFLNCREGDGGGVGLVDCDRLVVVFCPDLSIRDRGLCFGRWHCDKAHHRQALDSYRDGIQEKASLCLREAVRVWDRP